MQTFDPRLSVALGLHRAVPSVSSWHLRVARRLAEESGEIEGHVLSQALTAACIPADAHSRDEGAVEAEDSVHAGVVECPRWCVLPAALFPNGLQYFQQRAPQTASPRVQPHAVLANWVSQPHFEYRLREEGLWRFDEEQSMGEEAVASGERFLAFKELLINNGLSNTRNALRSALAIAELTNRTLILPHVRLPCAHSRPCALRALLCRPRASAWTRQPSPLAAPAPRARARLAVLEPAPAGRAVPRGRRLLLRLEPSSKRLPQDP